MDEVDQECSSPMQQSSPPCMLYLDNNNTLVITSFFELYLVSNFVEGDSSLEFDIDSLQQQQTLLQSDYGVEVAMEGDGEKKILKNKFKSCINV